MVILDLVTHLNTISSTHICKLQTCSKQKLQDDPEPDFELEESDEETDDLSNSASVLDLVPF